MLTGVLPSLELSFSIYVSPDTCCSHITAVQNTLSKPLNPSVGNKQHVRILWSCCESTLVPTIWIMRYKHCATDFWPSFCWSTAQSFSPLLETAIRKQCTSPPPLFKTNTPMGAQMVHKYICYLHNLSAGRKDNNCIRRKLKKDTCAAPCTALRRAQDKALCVCKCKWETETETAAKDKLSSSEQCERNLDWLLIGSWGRVLAAFVACVYECFYMWVLLFLCVRVIQSCNWRAGCYGQWMKLGMHIQV